MQHKRSEMFDNALDWLLGFTIFLLFICTIKGAWWLLFVLPWSTMP